MKFLSILALAGAATAAAVNKRGGEWNTWEVQEVTVTVTETEWQTTTTTEWQKEWVTVYDTVTAWQTTTEVRRAHYQLPP